MKKPILLGFPLHTSLDHKIEGQNLKLGNTSFHVKLIPHQAELKDIYEQTLSTPAENLDVLVSHSEILYVILEDMIESNLQKILTDLNEIWEYSLPFVYVESAGVSHTKEFFEANVIEGDFESWVNILVQSVEQNGSLYTHGMATLNQVDFIVNTSEDIEKAMGLLYSACVEALESQQIWKPGEKLKFEEETYRLQKMEQGLLAKDDPFFNPNGYLKILASF
jgi:hypothetical protein